MATPHNYLVSFEDVSASVGGSDISSIVELHLVASANGVPQITLSVDLANAGTGGTRVEGMVSLGNARAALRTYRAMVKKDGATLSLSLTCTLTGPGGSQQQRLSLSGWLLTDVAVTPVQRGGTCLVSLTFQHPLCKAHFGGVIPGPLATPVSYTAIHGGNPLSLFISAVQASANALRITPPGVSSVAGAVAPAVVHAMLLRHLTKSLSDLQSALKWTHGGMPAASYTAAWAGAMGASFYNTYAAPNAGNSLLQALLGHVIPECSLALGGDYTGAALELGPFEPWAAASLSVSESDVMTLSLPQSDPAPLSGVRVAMTDSASGGFTSYSVNGQPAPAYRPSDMYYVPQSELSAEYLYGPLQQFSAPGWLVNAVNYAQPAQSARYSDAQLSRDGGMLTPASMPRDGAVPLGAVGADGGSGSGMAYAAALLACARAYFETSYTKDWAFMVGARLMFSSDGGVICPGRVLSVKSDAGGTVLGGYVTQVEHVISVTSRAASTKITCTHPRFDGLPAAIASTTNALYT